MLTNYWSQVEGAVSLCKTSPKFSKFFTRNPCQFSLSLAIFLCQFGFSLPPWCFSFGGDFAWSSSRRSFCKYIITATEYRQLSKYSWKMERLAYSFRGLGLIIQRGFTCGIGLLLARLPPRSEGFSLGCPVSLLPQKPTPLFTMSTRKDSA